MIWHGICFLYAGAAKMKTLIAVLMVFSSAALAQAPDQKKATEIRLLETPLPRIGFSPLSRLDLFPEPAPMPFAFVSTLHPDSAGDEMGRRQLKRGLRSAAFNETMFEVSMATLAGLSLADYFTTMAAVKHPSLAESNPFFKVLVKYPVFFAVAKIGVTAVSFWGLKRLYKQNKTAAWILSAASNFAMSFVIANNLRLIKGAKGR
jgi:hypothetical protein